MKGKIKSVVMNGKEFPVEDNEDYELKGQVICDSQLHEINVSFKNGEMVTVWATNSNIDILRKCLESNH